eukprot:CAMPEP_0178455536 /NCGR_PEP_ID=MMETSP0689_2-20121128/45964_1 /TAXON_ID=160604 /ORGANISM="Amphidinium massartii, Strain CS-259" /LENGTH=880 /DNA_ID=CAMNT_0020081583 /DNA_START=236 /DNA_END=2878 /DNA_ORIENTATION=-
MANLPRRTLVQLSGVQSPELGSPKKSADDGRWQSENQSRRSSNFSEKSLKDQSVPTSTLKRSQDSNRSVQGNVRLPASPNPAHFTSVPAPVDAPPAFVKKQLNVSISGALAPAPLPGSCCTDGNETDYVVRSVCGGANFGWAQENGCSSPMSMAEATSLTNQAAELEQSEEAQQQQTRRLQRLGAKVVTANKFNKFIKQFSPRKVENVAGMPVSQSSRSLSLRPPMPLSGMLVSQSSASSTLKPPMRSVMSNGKNKGNGTQSLGADVLEVSPLAGRTADSMDGEGTENQDLQVRSAFRPDEDTAWQRKAAVKTAASKTSKFTSDIGDDTHPMVGYDEFMATCVMTPTSNPVVAWESFGAALIMLDVILVPLTIVFHPPEEDGLKTLNFVGLIYWTLNIPLMMFFVGAIVDGVVLMDPKRIARRYAKTWLLIDLLVVVPEWVFTLAVTDSGGARFVALIRIWRLFRTTRLLRVPRLRWIVSVLTELAQTNFQLLGISASIIKMMVKVFMLCHYIGCIWYLLGSSTEDDRAGSWVRSLDHEDWNVLYLKSVHWALAQFTPAPIDIHPQNTVERAFNVTVVISGMVCFSYVIGSITSSLEQLRSMNHDFTKSSWIARRYLHQHDVPGHLNIRIMRYLEKQYERHRSHVQMDSIKMFSYLSENLHTELLSAVYLPHLRHHSILNYMMGLSEATMQRLAVKGMKRKWLARGDFLFLPHDQPDEMVVPIQGKLQYIKVNSADASEEEVLESKSYILEVVLWTPDWICLGEASAITDCEIQFLSSAHFGEIATSNPHTKEIASRYARAFMASVNKKSYDDIKDFLPGEDLADLANPVIHSFEDQVYSMGKAPSVNRRVPMSISLARFRTGNTSSSSGSKQSKALSNQ